MATHPLAGQPAPGEHADRRGVATEAYYRPPPDPRPGHERRLRHQRPPRHAARRHVHRGAHPGDHPGDLRLPRAARGSTARCSWARTRTPLSAPGPAHRPGGAGRQRRRGRDPARRRRHADAGHLARDPRLQPGAPRPAAPTASSSRRRTTRRPTAASSTTRPTAARPTPTSPPGSRTAPTPCSGAGNAEVKRVPFAEGDPAPDDAPGRLRRPLRRGPGAT